MFRFSCQFLRVGTACQYCFESVGRCRMDALRHGHPADSVIVKRRSLSEVACPRTSELLFSLSRRQGLFGTFKSLTQCTKLILPRRVCETSRISPVGQRGSRHEVTLSADDGRDCRACIPSVAGIRPRRHLPGDQSRSFSVRGPNLEIQVPAWWFSSQSLRRGVLHVPCVRIAGGPDD